MSTYADESSRLNAFAEQLREEAAQVDARARAFAIGDQGESSVRVILSKLEADGWSALHRRRWPGTRQADLDHVMVGPGGLVVLDTKNWRGSLRFAKGRLYRDQADETDSVVGIAAQVDAVTEVVSDLGLPPAAITGALVFVQQVLAPVSLGRSHAMGAIHVERWLRALGQRLDPTEVARLHGVLEERLVPALPSQVRPRPVLRRRPKPRVVPGQAELFDARELDLAQMERAAAAGIEAWMTYLHPSQMDAVKRRNAGPSRLRGPAGCGKTVVALHRAAFLAGTCEGEGLFTSYVRTLPSVLGTLYARLSPGTADRFTFRGVHSLAHGMLRDAGVYFKVDPRRASTCFNEAWETVGRERLETDVLRHDYWHEEVFSVIKGRGLVEFEQYADLARIGRRTALNANQRRAVWDLYVEYQRLLERVGILDFDDVIDRACALAEEGHAKQFRFIFVDETQDLTLQAMRMLAALVTDERDGLTLVGDGQQAIYPGGFTLKEAGISVAGRSTVLDVNYRNSQAVLDFAESFVRQFEFDDLEDIAESGDRAVRAVRPGGRVLRVAAANRASAEVSLLQRLVEDQANGFSLASAAVLCHSRRDVARLRALIARRGIATVDLEDYDGSPVDALKVGTAKRAKGLEFARVYVPHAEDYFVEVASGERERVEREHRELFVALTRARDGLWICRAG